MALRDRWLQCEFLICDSVPLLTNIRSRTSHLISQPVAPEISFGREDIVGKIMRLLDRDTTCRVALVGSGEVG